MMTEQKSKSPSVWEDAGQIFSLDPLRRQVDRLFNEFSRGLPAFGPRHADVDFWPSAELVEGEKEATIRLELPGIEPKDVDISATRDEISIRGEKKAASETKKDDRITTERSYGSFSRVFALGYVIDPGKVHAKFDKGVLTIKIEKPAAAQTRSRKIEIH
jgi:HSP20 family protein